jgi:protein-L-isoaspartate(D-aspartate) O-methyltransferase
VSEISDLLARLEAADVPMSPAIRDAMLSVDIESFSDYDPTPFYHDRPLVFTETDEGGIKTISAPHMICTLLHHLELDEGDEVLLIGAKGGYLAALIGHIVGPDGGVTVVDPNRQVIEHVRNHLRDFDSDTPFHTRKMRKINHTPPNLPSPLNRVLVTGSLTELPTWVEDRVADGGFVIAPLGGRIAQRLIKREKQGNLFDTDLGGVLFGPVDICETESESTDSRELAGLFEDALEIGTELGVFDTDEADSLRALAAELRNLPENLPPIALVANVDDDLWDAGDEDPNDIFIHFDELTEELSEHPLFDLLSNASEWLTPLWPTMMALLETKMQHPGAPDATFEDFGFGHHEDLVP